MARKFRLTKKSAIFLGIAIVILSGALGYLIWRVNQVDTTAPTDSDASCPSGCYWNAGTSECTGPGGCIWVDADGNETTVGNAVRLECDPCESTEEPASCEFYSTTFTAKEYNGQTTFQPGYYKCDSAGYCIPCVATSSEAYPNWQDCQDKADSLNGSLVTNCPAGQYKWSCQQLADGSGYVLEEIPCVDTEDNEEPTANCGTPPSPLPSFSKVPTQIGTFPENGKVVLYYKSLLDTTYRPIITFKDAAGKSYPITMPALDTNTKRVRVVTEIPVKAGESITLVSSNDNRDQGSPECAPTTNNPKYISLGWIGLSGSSCGTTLLGPPTNGTQTPMVPVDVSSEISWAQSFGKQIVSKQCWADWMEWPGDYDFNDYFLQVSYVPDAPIIIETNPDWDISKSATSLCLEDNTANAQSQLTYTITVKNTGDGAGTISKIEDTLDSKVLDSFVETTTISNSGVYSNGKITWTFSTPLSIAAGTTRTFTYQIVVDGDSFGTYSNKVKLTPVGSDPIEAVTDIVASCTIPGVVTPVIPGTPGTSVPQTGLFDTTIGRIVGGFVLLLLGGIVYNLPSINRNNFKYREKFEKKVANR